MFQALSLILLLIATPAHANLRNGLIGYWAFEEGSGTTSFDSSWRGNVTTLTNTPTWIKNCPRGNCLNFVAASSQYASQTVDLSGTNIISLSIWANTVTWGTDDGLWYEITANTNLGTTGFYLDPNAGVGTCAVGNAIGLGLKGDVGNNLGCFTQPSANKWHHYVAILDKGQSTNEESLYIDGALQTPASNPLTANNTNNFASNTNYMMSRGGTTLFKSGQIDDVRIYNRGLTAQEIKDLYNQGIQIKGTATQINY